MSIQVNQFLSMIRDANEKRGAAVSAVVYLFCTACGKDNQPHTVTANGQWERFTCPCGHHEDYRVG